MDLWFQVFCDVTLCRMVSGNCLPLHTA